MLVHSISQNSFCTLSRNQATMKKIRLTLESLDVVSFATENLDAPPRGTVLGQATGPVQSCGPQGCYPISYPDPYTCGSCGPECQPATVRCLTRQKGCEIPTGELSCLDTCDVFLC